MILYQPILEHLLRPTRGLCAVALAISLAACAGQPVRFNGDTKILGADQALLLPPPGQFSVVGVTEKRFSNAVQQEIALSTNSTVPGQNTVQVRFYGTENPNRYGEGALSSASLTDARINSEMRGTLPGVVMVRSQYVVQNDFGPFGYAVGRAASNDLCLYAWQQLRTRQGQRGPLVDAGTIQIRLRLCDRQASEQQLLSLMYGFTLAATTDSPGWNPYGAPAALNKTLGASGAPIYPPSTPVLPAAAAPTAIAPAHNVATRPPARPVASTNAAATGPLTSQGTVVPSPVQSGRRQTGAVPAPGVMPSAARTSPPDVSGRSQMGGTASGAGGGAVVPSPTCLGTRATQSGQCP